MRAARSGARIDKDQGIAVEAWSRIVEGLSRSDSADDRALAKHISQFLSSAFAIDSNRLLEVRPEPQKSIRTLDQRLNVVVPKGRDDPDIQR